MKKLLGIAGTITIAGSGISGIIGNAPTKIRENYNLQNLNRVKRNPQPQYGQQQWMPAELFL